MNHEELRRALAAAQDYRAEVARLTRRYEDNATLRRLRADAERAVAELRFYFEGAEDAEIEGAPV